MMGFGGINKGIKELTRINEDEQMEINEFAKARELY